MAPNRSRDTAITTFQSGTQTALLFTTNMGLEDVVLVELTARSQTAGYSVGETIPQPFDRTSYALAYLEAPLDDALAVARRMRSVHHVLTPYHRFRLAEEAPLDTLAEVLPTLDMPPMARADTFRVTTVRSGEHDFTSMDVQRVAGAALQQRYGTDVDLEAYDVEVRVDVFDRNCLVSVQHTQTALSQRHTRVYESRAALKPNVAYGLLHLAHLDAPPRAVLDPFCGSGTILLEAAALWPEAILYGSDWDEAAVAGTRVNAEAASAADRVVLRRSDVRALSSAFPDLQVDLIATNPPLGGRLGERMDFGTFYRDVLQQAAQVLRPGGRAVLLALESNAFNKALDASDAFRTRHVRVVELSGLYPRLFVLERT